jgi:hypothetical protein
MEGELKSKGGSNRASADDENITSCDIGKLLKTSLR